MADDLDVPDGMRVLVIDDFHLAGAASADTLRWLVEYHPPSLQLVVASRVLCKHLSDKGRRTTHAV